MTAAFKPGDKVIANKVIQTKYQGIDTIQKDTWGIIHWYDAVREEAAVLFVGHLMAYRIRSSDLILDTDEKV